MFTGIIEETGSVEAIQSGSKSIRLTVSGPLTSQDTHLGDSISINGCCLTVVSIQGSKLDFEAVPETMNRTNLGSLRLGSQVNLERAVRLDQRLGGHIVQGHVDAVGTIMSIVAVENAHVVTISAGSEILKYIVEKGSITVDGISLTVASLGTDRFTVWIIPHTWSATSLSGRKVGESLNLEVDILAKYIERLMTFARPESDTLTDSLVAAGYMEQAIAV